MTAFSNNTYNLLHGSVREMCRRRKTIGKMILTHEEYILTFVPREARQLFRDAAEYVQSETRTHKFKINVGTERDQKELDVRLWIQNVGSTLAPPAPRKLEIQHDAPKEIVERIHTWALHGGDVAREFGRVAKVLELLNQMVSKQTMRYYWPSIMAICAEHEATKKYVQELQELKPPANPKPLPLGLLRACKQTAATIATVGLVPKDVAEDENYPVLLDITAGQDYSEEFAAFYGMSV